MTPTADKAIEENAVQNARSAGALTGRQWMRHSLVYAVGIACQSALSLFVVPIYTRRLPPQQYGVLELLARTQEILALFVMSGLAVAAVAFYQFEAENAEKQRSIFSTALTAVLLNSVLLWAVLLPLAPEIARLLLKDGSYAWAVRAFLLLIPLELTFQIGLVALQAQYKSGLFGLFSVGRLAVGLIINLVLVLWLNLGIGGIVASMLVHTGTAAVAISIYVFRQFGLRPRWELWTAMLRYGAPFIVGGALRIVLDSGDRYFLIAWRGASVVGLYAISYKLALVLTMLILTPFAKVWGASMIHIGNDVNGPKRIARTMTYLTCVYLYGGLMLSLAAPALLRWFTGPQYWNAYGPVPVVILAYLFFGHTLVADTAFYAKKKTHVKPWIMAASCGICFLLYWLLIPRWGAMGAAVATLGAFASFAVFTVIVAHRFLPVKYEAKRLTLSIGFAASIFLVCRAMSVNVGVHEILAALLGGVAYPALLYVCGFLHNDEKLALAQNLGRFWTRLALRSQPVTGTDTLG